MPYAHTADVSWTKKLEDGFLPPIGTPFWINSVDENSVDSYGSYGGVGICTADDIGCKDGDFFSKEFPDIIKSQYDVAVIDVSGILMAASSSLPPLVRKPLKMEPATLAEGTTTTITFTIVENHSRQVYITIIDEDTNAPIRDVGSNSGYGQYAVWDNLRVDLDNATSSSDLPYGKTFQIEWAGSLSGATLISGPHKLRLKVKDADGKEAPAMDVVSLNGTIDADGIEDTTAEFGYEGDTEEEGSGIAPHGDDYTARIVESNEEQTVFTFTDLIHIGNGMRALTTGPGYPTSLQHNIFGNYPTDMVYTHTSDGSDPWLFVNSVDKEGNVADQSCNWHYHPPVPPYQSVGSPSYLPPNTIFPGTSLIRPIPGVEIILHGVGGAGTGYVTVCSGNFPPVGTLDVFVKEPEFINALGGTGMKTFEINANALLSQVSVGSMQINMDVPDDLSAAAAHGMVTLYRRGDSSVAVPVSASVSNGKLSVTLSGDDMTGNFSLVAPSYSSMQVSTSSIEINGQPAYELVGNSGVTFSPAEITTQELGVLREQGKLPVTVAVTGPSTQESPAPALYAAYDAGQLNTLGVPVESLRVCGISASGELKIYKTSPAPMQPNKIVAEIDAPSPRYVVMGSTTPIIPDRTPPSTTLTVASAFTVDSASRPFTALDHVDLALAASDNNEVQYSADSGVAQNFWILDPPESVYQYGLSSATIGLFQSGNGSQPLSEGRHMILYGSTDNAGNYEDIKAYILNADHTPPVAEDVVIAGGSYTFEDIQYTNPRSTVTLAARDPESHEVASGVAAFQYFVDRSSDSCPAGQYSDPAAPPGSCDNNYAAAPGFQLSGGTHTLAYSPLDLVSNAGAYKISTVVVDDAAL